MREIIKVISIAGKELIIESSLARILKHSENGFFILSAFKDNFSEKINLGRHFQLQSDLREYGLGFLDMVGRWEEEVELSLFVPYTDKYNKYLFNSFKDVANFLAKKYDQKAFIIKVLEDPNIYEVSILTGSVKSLGKFSPDKQTLAKAYSMLKKGSHAGRPFIFEGNTRPQNYLHAMSMEHDGYLF